MATRKVTEGWTDHLEWTLEDPPGSATNLTGYTVALVLRRRDGSVVDTTGKTSVIDAANGRVRYIPAATDLLVKHSPYEAKWQATISGRTGYFPSGDPERIEVLL